MAAAVAMDLDQCEASKSGKATTAAALSLNKSSSGKISKSSSLRKNPIVQQAKPMPTSKIYNTDPMSFRHLVQQLTGYDAPPDSSSSAAATASTTTGPAAATAAPTAPASTFSTYPTHSAAAAAHDSSLSHQAHHHQSHHLHHHHQQQQQQQQQQSHLQQNHPRVQVTSPDPAVAATATMHCAQDPSAALCSSPNSSAGSPHQSSSRPVNTRLQRMAPPPLRPTFSFSFAQKLAQQQEQMIKQHGGGGDDQELLQQKNSSLEMNNNNNNTNSSSDNSNNSMTSPGAHPLSPISKRVSPMPLLSFSPLPVLSPTDSAWASFESPNTAAMKQLAQSILEGKSSSCNYSSGGVSCGRFPWSPLGLASPGLVPVPELFPDVKMIDSSSDDGNRMISNSSNSSSDFSFPEL